MILANTHTRFQPQSNTGPIGTAMDTQMDVPTM